MKYKSAIIFLLFLISMTAITITTVTFSKIQTTGNTEIKATANNSVAYIYDTNMDIANDFKGLLDPNGYSTTLINITEISSASQLGQYGLIIIGRDFQHYTVGIISELVNALRPIIGLGAGGNDFLKNLSLEIVSSIFISIGPNSINATSSTHAIFNTPNPIPTTGSITLYTTAPMTGGAVAAAIPSPTSDMLLIGRSISQPTWYHIVAQNDRYVLWGFYLGPINMSSNGQQLFLNIMNYYIGKTYDSPVPGFEVLFILIALPATIVLIRGIKIYRNH